MILKENLDKRVGDCLDGISETNKMTYREWIREGEKRLSREAADIDNMEQDELELYLVKIVYSLKKGVM